ncbi:MAG TPA: DUF805 domain-containing protein [Candidatus Limnocylindrales bacterium]|nr:DUF805 domain-containing protein [Candidatus Limnocylindrales bacterium]
MGPVEAVQTCLRKYVVFSGRASRPEFWWFFLFYIVALLVVAAIDGVLKASGILYAIAALGLVLPSLAAYIRRLHDTDHSGWWILISLIPLIGAIWLIILLASTGTPGPNRFGDPPVASVAAA